LHTLLKSLEDNNIDWCWWDFEGSMSIFNPVPRVQMGHPDFPLLNRPTDSPDLATAFGFALPYKKEKIDPLMRELLGLNSDYSFRMTKRLIIGIGQGGQFFRQRLTFSWHPIDEVDVMKYEVIGNHVTIKSTPPPFVIKIPTFTPFIIATKIKGTVPYMAAYTTNNQFELVPSNYILRVHKTDLTFVDIAVE
jgi:hypothetical protein